MKKERFRAFVFKAIALILLISIEPLLFGHEWHVRDLSSWHYRLSNTLDSPFLHLLIVSLMAAVGKRRGWLTAPPAMWLSFAIAEYGKNPQHLRYAILQPFFGSIIIALPIGILISTLFYIKKSPQNSDDDTIEKTGVGPSELKRAGRSRRIGFYMPVAAIILNAFLLIFAFLNPNWPEYWSLILDNLFPLIFYGVPVSFLVSFLLNAASWKRQERLMAGSKKQLAFFSTVLIAFVFHLIITIPIDTEMRQHHRTTREGAYYRACRSNLNEIKMAFYMYANENKDMFPPISRVKNNFIFEGDVLYPEYISDASCVACGLDPEFDPDTIFRLQSNVHHQRGRIGIVHPDCITDVSYCYLGWLITNEEEAEAFFEAYDNLSPENYSDDIIVPAGKGNGGGNVIHRLGAGAEKYLNDPSIDAFDIPVIWEMPSTNIDNFNHKHRDTNAPFGMVVYLNGQIDIVDYPGNFPMTKTMARLLDERPREPIPDCDE